MRVLKTVLIILFDIIFLGAFVFYLPELIQFFGNWLTVLLFVGIMVVGSGIAIGLAFIKSRRTTKMT